MSQQELVVVEELVAVLVVAVVVVVSITIKMKANIRVCGEKYRSQHSPPPSSYPLILSQEC